jgi:RHS repeat-associated protein
MTSATTNGMTTYYHSDGTGRRVRKASSSATLTRYVYDGQNLFMELDGSSAIVREYTYFPGVDEPHSVRQDGSIYYYMTEGPGNVVGLVNSSNQLVNHYRYAPVGNATLTTEGGWQSATLHGSRARRRVGAVLYRARYYDPEARRFISEDPIGLAGDANPYVYLGNDPVNHNDPSEEEVASRASEGG